MSRKQRRNKAPREAPRRTRSWIRVAAVVAAAAIIAILAWRYFTPSPAELFESAKREYARSPQLAAPLLLRAIANSGGDYADAELLLCCALARQGEWRDAAKRFQALELTGCDQELLLEFGELSFRAARHDLAENALAPVARSDHLRAEPALQMLAALYQQQQRFDEVIRVAELLAARSPTRSEYWLLLAGTYESLDLPQQAVDAYRRALQCSLTDADRLAVRHRLVEQLLLLGDAMAARSELEPLQADAATTNNSADLARIDVHLARLLRLEGHPDEALPIVNRALEQSGAAPAVLRLRGVLLLDVGDYQGAVADLSRVVAVNDLDEMAHYKLSTAYRRLQREDEAHRHLATYQRIHAKRMELARLQAKAADGALTSADKNRLAALYGELHPELTANRQ